MRRPRLQSSRSRWSPASAQTLRYANQGDLKSLDPYTLNESTTHAHLGHVFEGLVARDKDLKIIPALAESWETPEPTRWRFHLRKGVKFQNGDPFTADDVVFSADRVRKKGSNLQTRIPTDAKVVKVDDYTVDFILTSPNPILNSQWDTWYIMEQEVGRGEQLRRTDARRGDHAELCLAQRQRHRPLHRSKAISPASRPCSRPTRTGGASPNITSRKSSSRRSARTPRASPPCSRAKSTSSSRFRSRISRASNSSPNAQVLKGPELRTIFLGMDQVRDELLYSNVKGKNPFKDVKVREAFFKAVDIELIKTRVMRGLSTPSALMIAPQLFKLSGDFTRPKFDPDGAKKLLTEAGYPDGFEVTMDCPNDRYVNDAAICQAVVGMLARIGVKVTLLAQPKAQYFAKVLKPGGYQTSFYLLGWTPGTLDSHNVLYDIMGCRDDPKSSRGEANLGGYCNKKLDELTDKVLQESDMTKRDLLIKQAYEIGAKDFGYIPLHQQALAWGVSKKVKLSQRADNQVLLYWATKQD